MEMMLQTQNLCKYFRKQKAVNNVSLNIEKHGGKNVGSISKKTSFILAGENMGPSKLEKAEKLGIRIVNEEEFLGMIGE